MVKFLIGDVVGFDTDTFMLIARDDPSLSVPLGATAGRCLHVLLNADGEIVTKRTLLAQGWEQYGAVVSENNLSQSIVRIRKGLQQLGADPASLITLPRIGYRLIGVTRVTPFVDAITGAPSSSENRQNPAAFERENAQSVSSPRESSTSDVDSISATVGDAKTDNINPGEAPVVPAAQDVAITPPERTEGLRLGFATGIWLGVAALSAALAGWVLPDLRDDLRTSAPEARWVAVDPAADNRVFVSPSFQPNTAFVQGRLARLAATPPTSIADASERYVYINGAGSLNVSSYFLCSEPIGRATADCLSYLLIDHAKP